MPRHKRRRGGQPGNHNARKHGLYAANLSQQEVIDLCKVINEEGNDPALALIRMKFVALANHTPGNQRLLRQVSGQLYKWMQTNYPSSRRDMAFFRRFIREFRKSIANGTFILPEPTEAES